MVDLIIPTETNFDLKYDGDYEKHKVARKIILAVNQAIKDGFKLNEISLNVRWNLQEKRFKYVSRNFKWASIVSAILLYSNYTTNKLPLKPKTHIAAEILNVNLHWFEGFLYGLDGRYKTKVNHTIQRSKKYSNLCSDGVEIGELLRIAYLPYTLISSFDFTCDKINYDTHQWQTIDSKIIAVSLGAVSKQNIVQCKECKMFGGITFDYWNSSDSYYISKDLYNDIYRRKEKISYSCNEMLIKNILE